MTSQISNLKPFFRAPVVAPVVSDCKHILASSTRLCNPGVEKYG